LNTLEESLACPEGIADVSVVVVAGFDNPLKEYSIAFLSDALAQKRRVVIPVSTIMGAYHIATRCLKVSKLAVKRF
jgi:hypothetical protein